MTQNRLFPDRRSLTPLALLLLTLGGLLSGCRTADRKELELYRKHLVAFSTQGVPLNPRSSLNGWFLGEQHMTDIEYQAQVRYIGDRINAFAKEKGDQFAGVMIFIHGGLNDYADTENRVLELSAPIQSCGYYPIFIAWNSDLMSSYVDNLFYTQGSLDYLQLAIFPLSIVRDLVKGAMNVGNRTWDGLVSQVQRIVLFGPTIEGKIAASIATTAISGYEDYLKEFKLDGRDSEKEIEPYIVPPAITMGSYQTRGFQDYYRYSPLSLSFLTWPVRSSMSFLVDSMGKGSWSGMQRRVQLLFEKDVESLTQKKEEGALAYLMQEIRRVQADHSLISRGQHDEESGRRNRKRTGSYDRRSVQLGLELIRDGATRFQARLKKTSLGQDDDYEILINSFLDRLLSLSKKKVLLMFQELISGPPQIQSQFSRTKDYVSQKIRGFASGKEESSEENESAPPGGSGEPGTFGSILVEEDFFEMARLFSFLAFNYEDASQVARKLTPAWKALQEILQDPEFLDEVEFFLNQPETRSALDDYFAFEGAPETEKAIRDTLKKFLGRMLDKALALIEKQLEKERQLELPVDIIAHSMGTIVTNEILKRSRSQETPNFRNLVFMGSASSVKEYEEITLEYLSRKKAYGTHLHHLVLHPEDEISESMFFDIIPRGSLLVYIDHYLTNPLTIKDRRIGRFENLMFSLKHTPPSLFEQISIKVFSAGNNLLERKRYEDLENNPKKHSEFTPQEFWKESFWEVDEEGVLEELRQVKKREERASRIRR